MPRCIAPNNRGAIVSRYDAPRTGVGVLIVQAGKILLAPRPNPPQAQHWQCPGGFLRGGENVLDGARRRVREETGLLIEDVYRGPWTDNRFDETTHTVTLYVVARHCSGTLHPGWQWFDYHALPQPLFLPLQILRDEHAHWLRQALA